MSSGDKVSFLAESRIERVRWIYCQPQTDYSIKFKRSSFDWSFWNAGAEDLSTYWSEHDRHEREISHLYIAQIVLLFPVVFARAELMFVYSQTILAFTTDIRSPHPPRASLVVVIIVVVVLVSTEYIVCPLSHFIME